MNKYDAILEILQNLNNEYLRIIHNEYCYATNQYDDEIYDIDSLDEVCEGQDVYWIICRAFYGEFNPNGEYFKFNGYGNFKTIWSYELSRYIDIEDIANYIIENNDALYSDDIQKVLDEYAAIESRAILEG